MKKIWKTNKPMQSVYSTSNQEKILKKFSIIVSIFFTTSANTSRNYLYVYQSADDQQKIPT